MSSKLRVIRSDTTKPHTEQEYEANLSREGYDTFKWSDVPGVCYPRHKHPIDECIWILEGELSLIIDGVDYILKPGDRIYLPAQTPHSTTATARTPTVYLVGRKRDQ